MSAGLLFLGRNANNVFIYKKSSKHGLRPFKLHSRWAHHALEASGKAFCIALGGGGLPLQHLGFALSTMGGWGSTPPPLNIGVICADPLKDDFLVLNVVEANMRWKMYGNHLFK